MKLKYLIFLQLFFVLNNVYSQVNLEELENSINDNISIMDSIQTIKAHVYNIDNFQVKIKSDRYYFWFFNNKIFITQGGASGRLLHGEYVSYYLSSRIKEKGNFNFGLKNGKWYEWYENGNLKSIYSWKNGKLHGKYYLYSENGQLIEKGKYKRGSKSNKSKS